MRLSNRALPALAFTVFAAGTALVLIACSDSSTTGGSSGSSGTSGTSGTATSSGTTPATSSGTTPATSSGTTPATSGNPPDGGNEGGGAPKANGAECTGDNAECQSGHCAGQATGGGGGGGVRPGTFCTVPCDNKGATDAKCGDAAFTGACRNNGLCQVK